MKLRSALVAVAILLGAGSATAQEVYGRVWVAGSGAAKPADGAKVTVTCGAAKDATADQNGSYSVNTSGTGKCAVQVTYGKTSSRILIHVSGARTRANLELRPSSSGWSLARK